MGKYKNTFEDKEISWFRFNERVLEEAQNKINPLFERLHFISIFCNNLDEFFMENYSTLLETYNVAKEEGYKEENEKTKSKLKNIYKFTKVLLAQKDIVYKDIVQQFKSYSINQITPSNITDCEKEYLHIYFEKHISRALVPIIIGRKLRLPSLNNKQIIVAVSCELENYKTTGIVPIHSAMPRIILVPQTDNSISYILFEDLVFMFIEDLFKKYKFGDKAIIRITPIRMEYIGDTISIAANNIRKALKLDEDQVFHQEAPLDMSFVQELNKKIPQQEYNSLYYVPSTPQKTLQIDDTKPMIDQIKKKDILLSYPFEDFEQFIRLINEAGTDNQVQSIKITIYKVAKNSKIIKELIKAANNGKEVICIVELTASFDENENIKWAKKLENGGCKVFYGLTGFKVHAKVMLITMNSGDKQEYITNISTGNYNETTAKVYCDLSLITAHKEIGEECAAIFEKLQEGKFIEGTKHLFVAPLCFEDKIEDLIDNEIEKAKNNKNASIVLKLNSLTDRRMMKKLIQASKAGVKIQLIIRDICCLKAGVEGITENIKVRSVVGRFLEHSRIYKFGEGKSSHLYISSANLIKSNTSHRVEIAVPIYSEECKIKVCHLLDMIRKDNVKARIQMSNGEYVIKQIANSEKQFNYQIEMFGEEKPHS